MDENYHRIVFIDSENIIWYHTGMTKELLASILKEQYESFLARDRGVEREILIRLGDIVASPQVVVITGLRRVGKSTLLAQIASTHLKKEFFFVNFEDERLVNFQVNDFDILHETLISLFGDKKTFLFDEIQNVPQWERFVRRLNDQEYKFVVTGSNASLLSQELGNRLTGRSIRVELFPFSFREFLTFKNIEVPRMNVLTTKQRGILRKLASEYMVSGGIPDALKYPKLAIHKTLYDDVLYRDIATRYKLDNVKSIKELAFYLISNTAAPISFNKLKDMLKLGSVNTVKSYVDYLESSWLFFVINKYAYSVKEQQIAAKKVYCIDTGLASSVGFSFSENYGKSMENTVFLQLRRMQEEIFYYKTVQGYEVDFFLPKKNVCIQVSRQITEDIEDREVRALIAAAKEQKSSAVSIIVTEHDKCRMKQDGMTIQVVPLYEWLLAA